jgi:hypothetical protein
MKGEKMPEAEGYMGIINLLGAALVLMEEGEAKQLVFQARVETIRQAKQSVTSLEMGIDLGKLLQKEEGRESNERRGAE